MSGAFGRFAANIGILGTRQAIGRITLDRAGVTRGIGRRVGTDRCLRQSGGQWAGRLRALRAAGFFAECQHEGRTAAHRMQQHDQGRDSAKCANSWTLFRSRFRSRLRPTSDTTIEQAGGDGCGDHGARGAESRRARSSLWSQVQAPAITLQGTIPVDPSAASFAHARCGRGNAAIHGASLRQPGQEWCVPGAAVRRVGSSSALRIVGNSD